MSYLLPEPEPERVAAVPGQRRRAWPCRGERCPRTVPAGGDGYCPRCMPTTPRPDLLDPEYRSRCAEQRARYPRCDICGTTEDLTCDHVHAIALGGDPRGPLRTLCRSCNGREGRKVRSEVEATALRLRRGQRPA